MNFDDIADVGKSIADSVSRAVNSKDFSNLGNEIKNKVNDVTDRARRNMGASSNANPYSSTYRRSTTPPPPNYGGPNPYQNANNWQRQPNWQGQPNQTNFQRQPNQPNWQGQNFTNNWQRQPNPQSFNPPSVVRPSKAGPIALTVVGSIGMVANISMVAAGMTNLWFNPSPVNIISTIFFGAAAFLFGWLFGASVVRTGLVARVQSYMDVIGSAEYISLDDLSARTGTPKATVKRDVKKIIKKGVYPYARLDRFETTLMLSDKAYKSYEAADSSFRKRVEDEKKNKEAKDQEFYSDDPEVMKILTEGKDYIRTIREINDEIPDVEDMSDKLYELESIMKRIFAQVKERPENAGGIRKLMNYYLPTTVKLLRAYAGFYKQPDGGENIEKSKSEIEGTMDTINGAFLKFLDDMFEYQYYDVSSDINVMKHMMSQDGIAPDMVMKGEKDGQ